MDMDELWAKGWTLVDGISSKADLLNLGKVLGTPTLTSNGELVKEVRQVPDLAAPHGSQSSLYGSGPFPLHTDTVFWPTPVKYVLLRAYGDVRRPTTVMSFDHMVGHCCREFRLLLHQAVFLVTAGNKKFYCSLKLRCDGLNGWRYDADLMTPVNDAGREVHSVLRELVSRKDVGNINWSGSTAAVLCNWSTLHGRGEQPLEEGLRVIERLYVR